jgi:hypothetical protein
MEGGGGGPVDRARGGGGGGEREVVTTMALEIGTSAVDTPGGGPNDFVNPGNGAGGDAGGGGGINKLPGVMTVLGKRGRGIGALNFCSARGEGAAGAAGGAAGTGGAGGIDRASVGSGGIDRASASVELLSTSR